MTSVYNAYWFQSDHQHCKPFYSFPYDIACMFDLAQCEWVFSGYCPFEETVLIECYSIYTNMYQVFCFYNVVQLSLSMNQPLKV